MKNAFIVITNLRIIMPFLRICHITAKSNYYSKSYMQMGFQHAAQYFQTLDFPAHSQVSRAWGSLSIKTQHSFHLLVWVLHGKFCLIKLLSKTDN